MPSELGVDSKEELSQEILSVAEVGSEVAPSQAISFALEEAPE